MNKKKIATLKIIVRKFLLRAGLVSLYTYIHIYIAMPYRTGVA